MIRVYPASKIERAKQWHELQQKWHHVFFHARWLKHNWKGTPDREQYAKAFWKEDEIDVKHADAILLHAEAGEHLKGALVEVGIAIGHGIPVIVVGSHPDYSTWQFHPAVIRVANLKEAYEYLIFLDKKLGLHQAGIEEDIDIASN
jgi:hypothetical protein